MPHGFGGAIRGASARDSVPKRALLSHWDLRLAAENSIVPQMPFPLCSWLVTEK
jgi:hypothetical protein